MKQLSKEQIFQALECCIIHCKKCAECPLRDIDEKNECKQELVIQTARYITKLSDENHCLIRNIERLNKNLEQAETTISELSVYERIVNEQCDLLIGELTKRMSKILCNKGDEK